MQTTLQYWHFLIGGQLDDQTGVMGNFYAHGQHCGDALEHALQAAAQETGFQQPVPLEAGRLDILADFEEPLDLIPLTEQVSSGAENYSYPLETAGYSFVPPVGIIKSTEDGPVDGDLLRNGFVAYRDEETQAYELELVADRSRLIDTFLQAIGFLSAPYKLAVHIKGHWEHTASELWAKKLPPADDDWRRFLLANQANLLENGFVECAFFQLANETQLTLNEHKKITFRTLSEEEFIAFGQQLMALGFEQTDEQYSLEFEFYHWHYRPADSLAGNDLRLMLLDAGFDFEKSWVEESTEQFL